MNAMTPEELNRRSQIVGHVADQVCLWLLADEGDEEARQAEALTLCIRALRAELRGESGKADTLRAHAYTTSRPDPTVPGRAWDGRNGT